MISGGLQVDNDTDHGEGMWMSCFVKITPYVLFYSVEYHTHFLPSFCSSWHICSTLQSCWKFRAPLSAPMILLHVILLCTLCKLGLFLFSIMWQPLLLCVLSGCMRTTSLWCSISWRLVFTVDSRSIEEVQF